MKNEKQLKKYAPESMKMQEIKSGKQEVTRKYFIAKTDGDSDN
jgi:hypothetical protein